MSRLTLAAYSCATALAVGVLAAPAPASAATTLQITSPDQGSEVAPGTVAWTIEVPFDDTYSVGLECSSPSYWDETDVSATAGTTISGKFTQVPAGAECTLSAYSWDYAEHDEVDFSTSLPTPEVRNLRLSPVEFYPTVRDNYKESTVASFGVRRDSDVKVEVVDRDGRTIWTKAIDARPSRDWYERLSVRWNGTNRSGKVVRVGKYKIRVTTRLGSQSAKATTAVRVKSEVRSFTRTVKKDGWYDSHDTTSGNCYTMQHYYPHGIDLDCWGGAYAQASYFWKLPANAKVQSWWVKGEVQCCDSGKLIKTGARLSPTKFRVQVKVTYWRSYVVKAAYLRYSFTRRV